MLMDSKCTPPDIMVCYRVKKDDSSNNPNSNYNSNQLASGLNNQQTINSMTQDSPGQANAMRQAKLGASGLPLKQSKSRELRASIMYTGCDCEKRNGLQDDCLRSECRGSPQCLTKPNPTCGPSEFSNGKHLELKRLQLEKFRKSLQRDGPDSDLAQDSEPGYQNPYAQLFKQNDDTKGGNNKRGGKAKGGNHGDDCCCCWCCGDTTYYCYEGVLVDQGQQNQQSNKQGAAKCPGTAQCGPGICPVGECPGGVCATGGGTNLKRNRNDPNQRDDASNGKTDGSQILCLCDGKGRSKV